MWVTAFKKNGRVMKTLKAGALSIDIAGKRIRVPVSGIRRLHEQPPEPVARPMVHVETEMTTGDPPLRLMLIGKRVPEAMDELEIYLDQVFRARIPEVTIVHGFGTGRLQDAVVGALKKSRYVSRARRGFETEGGGGVTVVELNENPV